MIRNAQIFSGIRRESLKFRSLIQFLVIAGMMIFQAGAEDFTTSDDGTSWTLPTLSSAAPNTIFQEGPNLYTLKGSVTVSPADSLTIGAGETLLAENTDASPLPGLVIKGDLKIAGEAGNPARLGSKDDLPNLWRGILLVSEGANASSLTHAVIENAFIGVLARSVTTPVIEYCTFSGCRASAIHVAKGHTATIRDNTIYTQSATGVVLDNNLRTGVTGNTIEGGGVGIASSGSDSQTSTTLNQVSCAWAGLVGNGADQSLMMNNTCQSGLLGGVAGDGSHTIWRENTFRYQDFAGISISNTAAPKLRGNIFRQNGDLGGLYIVQDGLPDLGITGDFGMNDFSMAGGWDLVNFSAHTQYALGNTWSSNLEFHVIYDRTEDAGDADENGVLSGPVITRSSHTGGSWQIYE